MTIIQVWGSGGQGRRGDGVAEGGRKEQGEKKVEEEEKEEKEVDALLFIPDTFYLLGLFFAPY